MGDLGEVSIKRIKDKNFWITYHHEAGTRQEIYWLLKTNKLIPLYEFEYGGMNWESELSYNFKNIKKNQTIQGSVYGNNCESQIETLKQKFIIK